jgi:hypothetical protein
MDSANAKICLVSLLKVKEGLETMDEAVKKAEARLKKADLAAARHKIKQLVQNKLDKEAKAAEAAAKAAEEAAKAAEETEAKA